VSHGGNLWSLLEERSFQKGEILDFSSDLNPLGPPPILDALLQEASGRIRWYPEPTYRQFREAAARAYGIDPSCLLPGNGTAGLIHLISRWKAGATAAVVVPTFTEYERAVIADGGRVIPWVLREEEQFSPASLNDFGILTEAQILFLCNPNNPTGTLWPEGQILQCLQFCEEREILVVVDEAYLDFVEEGLSASMIPWIHRFKNLLVLRSLTKSFAIPGLRVGFLAGPPERMGPLSEIQPPWEMNSLAAFVGSRLAREREYLIGSRERMGQFRQSLWKELRLLPGLRPFPSAANFFLCRITDSRWSNERLAKELRDRGILVRNCDDFTGLERGRFIRVAVRLPEENQQLIRALREVLADAG